MVDPRPEVPVVGVAVVYGSGSRAERPGEAGLAHLVEHLMFRGSAHVAPGEHARLVERGGGVFNAVTRADDTVYHQVVPVGALEQVLFCEADRMRGLRLTPQSLHREVEVVDREIRDTVRDVPYGGFPRNALKAVLFDRFANAHDTYGDVEVLRALTVADVERFLHDHYTPRNAAVAVSGPVTVDQVRELVSDHFGDIPAGAAVPRPDLTEPVPDRPRHDTRYDPRAPFPAVAMGWRVPDPLGDPDAFLPYVVLAELLAGDGRAPLPRRLVRTEGVAVTVDAAVNLMGDPFGVRDPTGFHITVHFRPGVAVERVVAAIEEECRAVADTGPTPGERARVLGKLTARLSGRLDDVSARAVWAARFALQRNTPDLGGELLGGLAAVDDDAVRAAARAVSSRPHATVEVVTEPPSRTVTTAGAA